MTPGLRRLLLALPGSLALLLGGYLAARFVVGLMVQERIGAQLTSLSLHSDHQFETRAYRRGVLQSGFNLLADSPLIRGVVRASVRHGPLLDQGFSPEHIGLAGIDVAVPGRVWLGVLKALQERLPGTSVWPAPDVAAGSRLPTAKVLARLFMDGRVEGSLHIPDFDQSDTHGDVLHWRGFSGSFQSFADDHRWFLQLELPSVVLADSSGRELDLDSLSVDAVFPPGFNPLADQSITLDLTHARLGTARGGELVLDGLEWMSRVRPANDWLREFDLLLDGGAYHDAGGKSVVFNAAANLQINHLDQAMWSRLGADLAQGSGDAIVWSELARNGAALRLTRLEALLGGHATEGFGELHVRPLTDSGGDPWRAVDGRVFLDFERDTLNVLMDWDLAPYFSALVEVEQAVDPALSRDDIVEQEIATLVRQGLLVGRGGERFSAVLSMGADGLRLNGHSFGSAD